MSDYIFTPKGAGHSWEPLSLALLKFLVSEPSGVLFALPPAWLLIGIEITFVISLASQQFTQLFTARSP